MCFLRLLIFAGIATCWNNNNISEGLHYTKILFKNINCSHYYNSLGTCCDPKDESQDCLSTCSTWLKVHIGYSARLMNLTLSRGTPFKPIPLILNSDEIKASFLSIYLIDIKEQLLIDKWIIFKNFIASRPFEFDDFGERNTCKLNVVIRMTCSGYVGTNCRYKCSVENTYEETCDMLTGKRVCRQLHFDPDCKKHFHPKKYFTASMLIFTSFLWSMVAALLAFLFFSFFKITINCVPLTRGSNRKIKHTTRLSSDVSRRSYSFLQHISFLNVKRKKVFE